LPRAILQEQPGLIIRGETRVWNHSKLSDLIILPLSLVLPPIIYLAHARYNLPVSATVDERTSLGVLLRFHSGTLNPQFFMYPTLYYYLTFVLTKLFPFQQVLFWGRLLNLSFVGLTAYFGYLFCRDSFNSRAAGVIAALLIVASPTIVHSGSYLCTDVLLAAATMASLLLLHNYFKIRSFTAWLLSMVAIGVAVGCKYTAFLMFVAYVIAEILEENRTRDSSIERGPEISRIGRVPLFSVAFLIGLALLVSGMLFPTSRAIAFAFAHHTNADQRSTQDYEKFFDHIRFMLFCTGALAAGLGLLIAKFDLIWRMFSIKRLYLGLAIVLGITVLSTPYSMITPAKFLYDLGALARSNIIVQSRDAQWRNYVTWIIRDESSILVSMGVIGFCVAAVTDFWQHRIVVLFSIIYLFTIATAHVGFPRYLTPILPVVFVFSAAFLVRVWHLPIGGRVGYTRLLVTLAVILGALQLRHIILDDGVTKGNTDAFWRSYWLAVGMKPSQVLYAGYAPSVELNELGIQTRQVSWDFVGARPLGDKLSCGELLIYDLIPARLHGGDLHNDQSIHELLSDRRGDGQEVVEKSGCE
jgi:hypothetical protein